MILAALLPEDLDCRLHGVLHAGRQPVKEVGPGNADSQPANALPDQIRRQRLAERKQSQPDGVLAADDVEKSRRVLYGFRDWTDGVK